MLALAEELGSFVQYIGGQDKTQILLVPLETLCHVEESSVRDKAVESINKIAAEMTKEQAEEFLLPLVKRLASGNYFTSRSSSCGLFAVLFPIVSSSETRQFLIEFVSMSFFENSP